MTRPGIAAVASGLLVEIFVNLLQHPLGILAPASAPPASQGDPSRPRLGIVPHQIRGFLSSFKNLAIEGKAYDRCSACSGRILEAYQDDAWAFVKRVLNEKGFVEEVSGLAEVIPPYTSDDYSAEPLKVQRAAEKALIDMDAVEDLDDEGYEEAETL